MKKILSKIFIFCMLVGMITLSACSEHECAGEWTILSTPTIFSPGLQEFCCNECGETTQKEIPALGIEKGKEMLSGIWSSMDPATATEDDIYLWWEVEGDSFDSYFYMFGTTITNSIGGTYSFTDKMVIFTLPSGKSFGTFEYTIEDNQIKKLVSINEDGSKGSIYLKY